MRSTVLRRLATAAAVAVLLGGLSACGGGAESDSAAPAPTAPNPPATTSLPPATTTLKPENFADPFLGVRTAAGHMPDTAKALAVGFTKKDSAQGADTAAAALAASLNHLLTEYVYLTSLAMDTELVRPDRPENKKAFAALDAHAEALAAAIGTVASRSARAEFRTGWQEQLVQLMAHAISNDTRIRDEALDFLESYAKRAARQLGAISKGALNEKAFADKLATALGELAVAHRAVKVREDVSFRKLTAIVPAMSEIAADLAAALDKGGSLGGSTGSPGAALYTRLAGSLTSHVYLASTAVFIAYTAFGETAPVFTAAANSALGNNSTEITEIITSVAPDARAPFDQSWAAHVNDVVAYAGAAKADDDAAATRALASLEAYRTAAGTLFSEASGGALPAAAVSARFETHIESLTGTIDALAAFLAS